jgi:SAM-dependent methyltransferase
MKEISSHASLFQCPISGAVLRAASENELAVINQDILSGKRLSRFGSNVPEQLGAALVTDDARFVYRVADDVACLLAHLAIVQRQDVVVSTTEDESSGVRRFYDELGWVQRADGSYEDTALFTEAGTVADQYRIACNRRVGKQLRGGTYLLDVASGAIPHPEYLQLSANYDYRICVDFSIRALHEARKKLGEKAICVLGDITCLPLRDGVVDDSISLHTIYHVPLARQTVAIDEVVRVTKPAGRAVIVYTWAGSPAMDLVFKMRGMLGCVRRLGRPSPAAVVARTAPAMKSPLYFHPQNVDWYDREIKCRYPSKLLVWSFISTTFQQRFFRSRSTGSLAAKMVEFIERLAPSWCGRYGQYPMLVIEKAETPAQR